MNQRLRESVRVDMIEAVIATEWNTSATGEKMDQPLNGPAFNCRSDTDLLRVVFQGKWRLKVLQEIVKGPVRLSQLRRAMPQCSKKVLIDTLHRLEGLSWIERREFPAKLKRVEYSLTGECQEDVRRAVAIASSKGAISAYTQDQQRG